ncbi:DUF6702 family protein [Dyadobacter tibetensis]|uniref:DUF6702 family protein n=1 Tax=Dyadobacter tibetensis TaxID=1211851 RepID=UPI00103ADE56|nr:DUF6702 family protein [Dyadobacter tibetensis]
MNHLSFWLSLVYCLARSLGSVEAAMPPLVHEYHVSVTQMQYNSTTRSLEISLRVFTDDLETALSMAHANRRFVINNQDHNNVYIEKYIRQHFVLTDAKEKTLPLTYLGKEAEADATWIYLEIPLSSKLQGHILTNSTLLDVFNDQVNMTNLKWGDNKKTFLFKKGQTRLTL